MNEVHYWIYQYAPAWTSEQWAYVVLALSLIGVLYRFFAQRANIPYKDKIAIGIDFAEAEARNLRNRAKAEEINKEKK